MYTDPIGDMLNRIKNAQAVNKATVDIRLSNFNQAILGIIKENGYIKDFQINNHTSITVTLEYVKNRKPKIQHIKRISTPGRHTYVTHDAIKPVLNNYGISIISTNKGVMTNKQAKKAKLGGELICEIY